jgi:polyketide synthase PksN
LLHEKNTMSIGERFQAYALQLFEEIQAILRSSPTGKVLVQLVLPFQENQALYPALSALLKTAQLENPHFIGQVIEVEAGDSQDLIEARLQENSLSPADQWIRYQLGRRYVARWSELTTTTAQPLSIPWRNEGVYLMTGGAGRLGLLFAREITHHVSQATLILAGRSPLTSEQSKHLQEITALGLEIHYWQTDVTDEQAVTSLIQRIQSTYGNINGIIHSAGIIHDNFIIQKSSEQFLEVLAPKVNGLVHVDQATQGQKLDFFVIFSSAAASFGNAGQADYATANAFMDAYAHYRNTLVTQGQRQGHTLSLNWPLWKDGGMHLDREAEALITQTTGMEAIDTSNGIKAFYQGLASGLDQVVVMNGNLPHLQATFLDQASKDEHNHPLSSRTQDNTNDSSEKASIYEKALYYFKKLLSPVIKVPIERIQAEAALEIYGIDSIMIMKLTNQLEQTFGPLPKTLFFEYQTIQALTSYFIATYDEQLQTALQTETPTTSIAHPTNGRITSILPAQFKQKNGPDKPAHPSQPPTTPHVARQGREIAIIGLAGRYPGAQNVQEFWQNLCTGTDSVSEIPHERWDDSQHASKHWGGFLKHVDHFDPLFFNISPRDAEMMDPQERLFLECVYEAMEDAGYTRKTLQLQHSEETNYAGDVGVFVGAMYHEYQLYGAREQLQGHAIALSGNAAAIANRVSYFCNFSGPSIALDTMCSSSLAAIHLACQSILNKDCKVAIAGGVNISIHPNKYVALEQGKFLSSDGRCKSFGAGGDGYVPGEGVGAVLLKTLAEAIADGDHIYAIIKGTAINHGGKTNGYTVPNPHAQTSVIEHAFATAGIDPRTISYIEAHGTGTSLGDPIEIASLTRAFNKYTREQQFCALGSVKSNIGHAESAAGIAALTKVLLQIQHQKIVPSLHAHIPNPHIDFAQTPFFIQRELSEWRRPTLSIGEQQREYPRLAGISSFGAGGSNAHIVIEEYISTVAQQPRTPDAQQPALIVLSAKSQTQLRQRAEQLLTMLHEAQAQPVDLAALAYTLQVGREAMDERLAIVAATHTTLTEKLEAFLANQAGIEELYSGQARSHRELLDIFTSDEDMSGTLQIWIDKGKYHKLLQLWVTGLPIDWNRLYTGMHPGRISLPTYPFAHQRYWVPATMSSTTTMKPAAVSDTLANHHPTIGQPDEQQKECPIPQSPDADLPLLLHPFWNPLTIPEGQRYPAVDEQILIIGGTPAQIRTLMSIYPHALKLPMQTDQTIEQLDKQMQALPSIGHLFWIAPPARLSDEIDEELIRSQNECVLHCFRLLKVLLQQGYAHRQPGCTFITIQAQQIHPTDQLNPAHASIHGLVGSLAKEYPSWQIRLLDLPAQEPWPLDQLLTLPPDQTGRARVYRRKQWYQQELLPLSAPITSVARETYRQEGIYVIIGGTGGIGQVWSEYLLRTYRAQLIWIGRRPLDGTIQAQQEHLSQWGPRPDYIQADATNIQELTTAYQQIKQRYPRLHGIIQSTVVLHDQSIAQMDTAHFQATLATKVDVSVHLAQVFAPDELDFVLFFSSLNAFATRAGQSNYAAACTFEDAFARHLRQRWSCPVKVMYWGYWGSIGIVATANYREHMARMGQGSIEPPEAIEAVATLLNGPMDQLALLKTTSNWQTKTLANQDILTLYPQDQPSCLQEIEQRVLSSSSIHTYQQIDNHQQKEEIEKLLSHLLIAQLQSMGLFSTQNSDLHATQGAAGIRDAYTQWLQESLILVTKQQKLTLPENDTITHWRLAPTDSQSAWMEWETQKIRWLNDPTISTQMRLVETMLRALPAILTGSQRATEIMFPHGALELIEGIYQHNAVVDYFNNVLADCVIAYVQNQLAQTKNGASPRIRILEIGAGTGGTSTTILQKLLPYQSSIQEYCYTDISEAFLQHAHRVYAPHYPFLTTRLFNVERALSEQTIDQGGYDLVIAANVLHATRQIHRTLRNTKATMKAHGLLLLNEIASVNLYTHLTFGLLDGWFTSEDLHIRMQGSPGLTVETWEQVLKDEGFLLSFVPTRALTTADQQIIVAESNGLVRQPQAQPTTHQPRLSSQTPTQRLNTSSMTPTTITPLSKTEQTPIDIRAQSIAYFKELIGNALKLPADQIDSTEPFQTYGMDSILIIQLADNLRHVIGEISTSLFFEYPTIAGLTEYFLQTRPEVLRQLIAPTQSASISSMLPIQPAAQEITRRFRTQPATQSRSDTSESNNPIAIVGLAGRYPGAPDLNIFWENLLAAKSSISEIPAERWKWQDYFEPTRGKQGSLYTKWGGFLSEIDTFDPLFFGISPREARQMDPQERIFLETAYACIQDAGYTPQQLDEQQRVGVFVGVMNSNYPSGTRYWSIANRISYLLNFHGPSIALDTACSSSLTAIHLALESLRHGTCTSAIAGGVNLIVDPVHYLRLSEATMLSSSEQCRAFGEQADGFVDGEGVGAVLLKPLTSALAAGDHIYGVIKGSMINAGGKTAGYTVPSPQAQAQVISEALHRAHVPARSISYLEAHGTGTSLGDPIEIAGLTNAFMSENTDTQYCALGSVKSNIGHAESASGIAGLTKILLQLKHHQLVPSLHARTPNRHINFASTPFILQQEPAPWLQPYLQLDGIFQHVPRRAGISSFGAGGANAHIIIEEYLPDNPEPINAPQHPTLIILSAKTEEQLRATARRLLHSIQTHNYTQKELPAIAYTLQVGREAMQERLAFQVQHIEEMIATLTTFLNDDPTTEIIYRGQVKQAIDPSLTTDTIQQTLTRCLTEGNYAEILTLWCRGYTITWPLLYTDTPPHRISLPGYPFAREHYWFTESQAATHMVAPLHLLVQQNTSHFYEQRFSSTFSGQEFFLEHHVVKGKRVMPAVAYLEMARAAIMIALDHTHPSQQPYTIRLKDIVWAHPMMVQTHPVQVHISLVQENAGDISYKISGPADEIERQPILYSQGRASVQPRAKAPTRDIAAIQMHCQQQIYTAAQCYDTFHRLGIDYGPAHQTIQEIHVGQDQALAQISLPIAVSQTLHQFILHPSLLDGALQAMQGLHMGTIESIKPSLPFALDEITIFDACASVMWAWVHFSEHQRASNKELHRSIQKINIDLCDAQGNISVQMKGVSCRVFEEGKTWIHSGESTSLLSEAPHPGNAGGARSIPEEDEADFQYCLHLSEQISAGTMTEAQLEHIILQ